MYLPSKIHRDCESFGRRQLTCFSISCLGLFCDSVREFVANNLQELENVWGSRGATFEPGFMSDMFHEMVSCVENATDPSEELAEKLDNSFVSGDDGVFENSGRILFDCTRSLANSAYHSFRSKIDGKMFAEDVDLALVNGICLGLYNKPEPFTPYVDAMEKGILGSDAFKQALLELEEVVSMAKHERILPLGERRWDYEFFQLPFDGTKNKDMDKMRPMAT